MITILAPDEGRVFAIGGDRVTVKGVADGLGVQHENGRPMTGAGAVL
jgi:hypothetical protein